MDHLESKSSYEVNRHPISSTYHVVSLNHRQISWLTIGTLCLVALVFLGGYFVGANHLSYWFSNNQQAVALHDNCGTCTTSSPSSYYAQLASFGSRHAATLFVEHLQQKKIIAKVVERKNETVSGKNIIWYQVVTERFDTHDELCELLRKIEKEEKLNDIRIIVC